MANYYVDPGNANVTAWVADTVYAIGDYVRSTSLTAASAGYVFQCTAVAGDEKSGASEPEWVLTTPDTSTTTDDQVTWTLRNPDSWEEALPGLQGAADRAVAGDTVYCRGTQTISAAIDFDINSGTYDGGYIKFIGCNAAGSVDGTQFVLDANGANINCIYANTKIMVWIANFKIGNTHSSGSGINCTGNCDKWVFINCWLHTTGMGLRGSYRSSQCIGCKFSGSGYGIYQVGQVYVEGCTFVGCTTHAINSSNSATQIANSIFHACNRGAHLYSGGLVRNCVFDNNTEHSLFLTYLGIYLITGCRFTNNVGASKYAVYCDSATVQHRTSITNCYFQNNTANFNYPAYVDTIPLIDGTVDHVVTAGTDTDAANSELYGGYTDVANDDFNLKSTATLRATPVALP